MEIGVNEIKLLEVSTKEVIKEIKSNKRATAVKVKAFQLLLDNGKEVQNPQLNIPVVSGSVDLTGTNNTNSITTIDNTTTDTTMMKAGCIS